MRLPRLDSTAGVHVTKIGWCDFAVGGPVRFKRKDNGDIVNACVKVSPACASCYAETIGLRWKRGLPYTKASMDLLEPFLDDGALSSMVHFNPFKHAPFKGGRHRPLVFLGDMTDLCGDWVKPEWFRRIIAVIAGQPGIDWLILTKRPEIMAEQIESIWAAEHPGDEIVLCPKCGAIDTIGKGLALAPECSSGCGFRMEFVCPRLTNLWLGTSVERQKEADIRVPQLLRCRPFAGKLLLSVEPLLGRLKLPGFNAETAWCPLCKAIVPCSLGRFHNCAGQDVYERFDVRRHPASVYDLMDWVIVGCESNSSAVGNLGEYANAREWLGAAMDLCIECRESGVAFFMKQGPGGEHLKRVVHDLERMPPGFTQAWPEPERG